LYAQGNVTKDQGKKFIFHNAIFDLPIIGPCLLYPNFIKKIYHAVEIKISGDDKFRYLTITGHNRL